MKKCASVALVFLIFTSHFSNTHEAFLGKSCFNSSNLLEIAKSTVKTGVTVLTIGSFVWTVGGAVWTVGEQIYGFTQLTSWKNDTVEIIVEKGCDLKELKDPPTFITPYFLSIYKMLNEEEHSIICGCKDELKTADCKNNPICTATIQWMRALCS